MSSGFPRLLYPIQYEDLVRAALAEDLVVAREYIRMRYGK